MYGLAVMLSISRLTTRKTINKIWSHCVNDRKKSLRRFAAIWRQNVNEFTVLASSILHSTYPGYIPSLQIILKNIYTENPALGRGLKEKVLLDCWLFVLQLKEYEKDPYFLQLSQNLIINFLIVDILVLFCRSWEREIVFFLCICKTGRTAVRYLKVS